MAYTLIIKSIIQEKAGSLMRFLAHSAAFLICCSLNAWSSDAQDLDECIVEGSHIQLVGKLVAQTFPGAPNYESIKKGDKPETYWILNTEKPYCGEGYNEQTKALSRLDKSCSHFQLMLSPEQYENQKLLLGKNVVVKGEMVLAKTGHQHTSMLIHVHDIEQE